jgi:hypothetical protein
MDDLVSRLESSYSMLDDPLHKEAAARIEELEAALKPFAHVIEKGVTEDLPDNHPAWFGTYSPVVGDFKRAHELVGEKKDD